MWWVQRIQPHHFRDRFAGPQAVAFQRDGQRNLNHFLTLENAKRLGHIATSIRDQVLGVKWLQLVTDTNGGDFLVQVHSLVQQCLRALRGRQQLCQTERLIGLHKVVGFGDRNWLGRRLRQLRNKLSGLVVQLDFGFRVGNGFWQ